MARPWRRMCGLRAVAKYRTLNGVVGASAEMGVRVVKAGFTGKPVWMIFSSGMPQQRMISRVVWSVTRK